MGGIVSRPSPPPPPPPPPAPTPEPEPPSDTLQAANKRRASAEGRALGSSTGATGDAGFASKTLLGQ